MLGLNRKFIFTSGLKADSSCTENGQFMKTRYYNILIHRASEIRHILGYLSFNESGIKYA
jgi:hypothetical protein